jgi:threonyl-tRNA synthetase
LRQNLFFLQRSASRLLAAALVEIDPSIRLLHGDELKVGFYYDFLASHELSLPFLHLVQERMRKLVKESHPIERLEMMAKNAKEYLNHLSHHSHPLETEEGGKEIVTLMRLKDFVDPCAFPLVKNTNELAHFRLFSIQKIGKNHFRILGSANQEEKALIEEGKLFAKYEKKNHLAIGEKLDLFHRDVKGFFWHPQGALLKTIGIDCWKREEEKERFSFIETPYCNKRDEKILLHKAFFEKMGFSTPFRSAELFFEENLCEKEILLEGLLNPSLGLRCLSLSFVLQKELLAECISSLQFIDKILNIFNFGNHSTWVFFSPRKQRMFAEKEIFLQALNTLGFPVIHEDSERGELKVEVQIKDGMGREWLGPYLSLHKKEEKVLILEKSALGLVERWIALWIEHSSEKVFRVLREKKIS